MSDIAKEKEDFALLAMSFRNRGLAFITLFRWEEALDDLDMAAFLNPVWDDKELALVKEIVNQQKLQHTSKEPKP